MKITNFLSGVVAAIALLSGTADAISGVATYYSQQGAAGSCGVYHHDNEYIVALGYGWGHNSYCGRRVNIRNPKNGRFIQAVVADTCPGCEKTKLDVSEGLYVALVGELGLDPLAIDWNFA
ncbi:uncharacterized protein RSE6_13443 [Rhynchosporium secalis]|uniref:RlpA-like protein double-psi beta-barrel domain-containing protein n=1 Tax=Rhynchosporium secalis TaxID=38038 RepID=A0A1E1MTQ6_RHYSE|nr:uncharacterized protein RSE6_13443 [Rhynchosporium secalis]